MRCWDTMQDKLRECETSSVGISSTPVPAYEWKVRSVSVKRVDRGMCCTVTPLDSTTPVPFHGGVETGTSLSARGKWEGFRGAFLIPLCVRGKFKDWSERVPGCTGPTLPCPWGHWGKVHGSCGPDVGRKVGRLPGAFLKGTPHGRAELWMGEGRQRWPSREIVHCWTRVWRVLHSSSAKYTHTPTSCWKL